MEQIAANQRTVVARRDAIREAEKQATEYAAVLRPRQDEAKAAEAARGAAEQARTVAQSALGHHEKIARSVDAALAATEAAQQLLPGDATVAEAARKLKAKSDDLKTLLPGLKGRIDSASATLQKADGALASANGALRASNEEKLRRDGAVAATRAALTAAESRANALRAELAEANDDLVERSGNQFALAQLKPLSPEQMCWSILKVTGVYDRYLQAEEAALNKSKPLTGPAASNPAARRARAIEVEQHTFDKLKANVGPFITIFAAAAGQPQNDFFATAEQALFAANGGSINSWIAPAGGNISERMIQEKDPRKAADDLYSTILSRSPSVEESADVVRVLAVGAKDKPAAVQELVWGLLTSAEFRFNH